MTTTKQRVRNAVRADRWDQIEFEASRDRLERLPKMIEEVEEVNWTAPPLVEDIWQSLFQQFPRRAEDLDPAYRPNAAALDEIEGSEAWRDLKPLCTDDRTASSMGTLAMRSQLLEVAQRLHMVQDKADEAQAKLDEYREAAEHAADGGEPDLDSLLRAFHAARDDADAALDGQMPAIGKAMRQAADSAAAAAQQEAENAAGWGITNPGELASMDPASRIALGEQMATPQMRRIMEKVGQLKNLWFGEHQSRLDPTPDEIHDIELGDDLGRLLTSELAGLVMPELEDEFYRRLVERQLLVYELTSTEKVGRGGMYLLEDSSGSMAGERTTLAKGLGLALESIARSDGRAFEAFMFGGPGQVSAWPCTTVKDRLAYAGAFLNAADTAWQDPIDAAVARLTAEFEATGKVSGDIILATDGDCDVTDAWLEGFNEAKARLGFKLYSIAIGKPPTPMLEKVSDFVAEIVDLVTCADVHAVFRRL